MAGLSSFTVMTNIFITEFAEGFMNVFIVSDIPYYHAITNSENKLNKGEKNNSL